MSLKHHKLLKFGFLGINLPRNIVDMWIIAVALLILGCLIYSAITIMSFLSQSGLLATQQADIQTAIDHKQSRLDDYRLQAEQHQETVPQLKDRVTRLQNWINALKRQKTQVASQKSTPENTPRQSRDAAIRKSLASVQKRKA